MNKIDKLRKSQAKVNGLPPVAITGVEKLAQEHQPVIQPVSPPDKKPMVKYKCGHQRLLATVTNLACPDCRGKSRQAKLARNRERAKVQPPNTDGRLPDGANFVVVYCAAKQEWSGSLLVGEQAFVGQASGVERLLRDLAGQYRATVSKPIC